MGYVNKELLIDYSIEINDAEDIMLIIGTNWRRVSFLIHSDRNYPDVYMLQKKFECVFNRLKENNLINLTINIQTERYFLFSI